MTFLFGITGPKFSGKTTVAKLIRNMGFPVVDWDLLCSNMLSPGTDVHRSLIKYFDELIIDKSGSINVGKLAVLMQREPWINEYVNDLIYNTSVETLDRLINAFNSNNIFFAGIESIGLMETMLVEKLDLLIFISTPIEIRKKRLLDKFEESISDIILEKESHAITNLKSSAVEVVTIINDAGISELNKQCKHIMDVYTKLSV